MLVQQIETKKKPSKNHRVEKKSSRGKVEMRRRRKNEMVNSICCPNLLMKNNINTHTHTHITDTENEIERSKSEEN